MSIRVLHLASGDGWGGAERVLSVLLEGFRQSEAVETSVMLFNTGQLSHHVEALGVPLSIADESGRSLGRLIADVRRHVRESQPDVIHAHRYKEILVASLATPGTHTRIVVTVHGLESARRMGAWRAAIAWGSLVLARCRGARFVTVSPELAHRLGRVFGSESVTEIGNPIPEVADQAASVDLRGQLGWSPTRTVVGFVGRLEDVKGPDLFLEVAAAAPSAMGFVLVGSGSMEGEIRDAIGERNLGDRVRLIGEVPDATPYMRELDTLAMTSRHEGTPMVLLEAARCRVPVLSFDVGGVSKVMEGAPPGCLVAPLDTRAFADALTLLLRDRVALGEGIDAWATSVTDRYSMKRIVAAYVGVYSPISALT